MPVGSLRELVTYPHTKAEMLAHGRTDEDVREVRPIGRQSLVWVLYGFSVHSLWSTLHGCYLVLMTGSIYGRLSVLIC